MRPHLGYKRRTWCICTHNNPQATPPRCLATELHPAHRHRRPLFSPPPPLGRWKALGLAGLRLEGDFGVNQESVARGWKTPAREGRRRTSCRWAPRGVPAGPTVSTKVEGGLPWVGSNICSGTSYILCASLSKFEGSPNWLQESTIFQHSRLRFVSGRKHSGLWRIVCHA